MRPNMAATRAPRVARTRPLGGRAPVTSLNGCARRATLPPWAADLRLGW